MDEIVVVFTLPSYVLTQIFGKVIFLPANNISVIGELEVFIATWVSLFW